MSCIGSRIKTNAHVIVSNNIKHSHEKIFNCYGIKIKSAGDFYTEMNDLNPETAIEAFREMVLNKKNPGLDEYEVLIRLRKEGLNDTANYLHSLI